jgi:hypothetical protein
MKIAKSRLKQIIKEEMNKVLKEADFIGPFAPPRVGLDTTGKLKPGDVIPGGMDPVDEPLDPIEQLAAGGQSTDEVLDVLRQLFDLVPPEDAQRFADEAQSLAQTVGGDEPPFRGPDPRKTAELRQQTRAQGGYSGKGAWKSRE